MSEACQSCQILSDERDAARLELCEREARRKCIERGRPTNPTAITWFGRDEARARGWGYLYDEDYKA